jgi:hypothetical protein
MLESIGVGLQLHDDVIDWEEDWARGGAWAVALARGLRGGAAIAVEVDPRPAESDAGAEPEAGAPGSSVGSGGEAGSAGGSPAGGQGASSAVSAAVPGPVRRFVLESGVLSHMLAQASRSFRHARRRAEVFGVRRVASWAAAREAQTAELARCEAESPGYASRARALSAWARAVLA